MFHDDPARWPPPPRRLQPMENKRGLSTHARLALCAGLALIAILAGIGYAELATALPPTAKAEQPVMP